MPRRYGSSRAIHGITQPIYGSQLKPVLDLATPEKWKAELTLLVWLHTEVVRSLTEDGFVCTGQLVRDAHL